MEPQLPFNSIFAKRYKIKAAVGEGGYAVVYKAEDTLTENSIVALKVYKKDQSGKYEMTVTEQLAHRHLLIPKHFDEFEGNQYLTMLFCEGGSLRLKLARQEAMTEREIALMLAQVSDGLNELHQKKICHDDIKPDNILLLSNNHYMLADFGISSKSTVPNNNQASIPTITSLDAQYGATLADPASFGYTPEYASPEKEEHYQITKASVKSPENDIYSLGVTLYELMKGERPRRNAQGHYPDGNVLKAELLKQKKYSKALCKLVAKCLSHKPTARPTAEDLETLARNCLKEKKWTKRKAGLLPPWALYVGALLILGLVALVVITTLFPPEPPVQPSEMMSVMLGDGTSIKVEQQEVTNEQYAHFLNETLSRKENISTDWIDIGGPNCKIVLARGKYKTEPGYEKHPVVRVSALGAEAYATWLGRELPGQVEWEFLIESWRQHAPNLSLEDFAWCKENAGEELHPVCTRQSYGGVYDFFGNVAEWVKMKDNTYGVVGGDFNTESERLMNTNLMEMDADVFNSITGFRCIQKNN